MSEHKYVPDWEWIEELFKDYKIIVRRTNQEDEHNFTSLLAAIETEIPKRYIPREKPNYIEDHSGHTSEEYIDSKRIHGPVIDTMSKMGYGLLLDGHTFYKIGYELGPYRLTFDMHHAYEIHRFLTEQTPPNHISEAINK